MKVIICEPNKKAYVKEIENDLDTLQGIVGGYIEAIYPYEDNVTIILNEEGKLMGLPCCRNLVNDNGTVFDYCAGNMIIAGLGEDDFCSLTDKQIETYLTIYGG